MSQLPTRKLGSTDRDVTIVGLGGVKYNQLEDAQAAEVINRALDLGITYIDTANSYPESERKLGLVTKDRREGIFIASKSTARDKDTMRQHVELSLERLGTDHIDCYQLHDLESEAQLAEAFAPNGAIAALEEFRDAGVIDYIGLTGHRNPEVLCKGFELYPFDTVLVAMGAVHEAVRPFYPQVSAAAASRKAGILAMKVMAYGFLSEMPANAVRFALTQDNVASAIVGVDDIPQLEEIVQAGIDYTPMTTDERKDILEKAAAIYNKRKEEAWFVHLPIKGS